MWDIHFTLWLTRLSLKEVLQVVVYRNIHKLHHSTIIIIYESAYENCMNTNDSYLLLNIHVNFRVCLATAALKRTQTVLQYGAVIQAIVTDVR